MASVSSREIADFCILNLLCPSVSITKVSSSTEEILPCIPPVVIILVPFVTSSLNESEKVKILINKIDPDFSTHFTPKVKGIHGSRALWKTTEGYETYWASFNDFLTSVK